MYHIGIGVRPDDSEAVHWFRRAAEQGHVDAKVNLIYMREKGRRVTTKAPPEAVHDKSRVQAGTQEADRNVATKAPPAVARGDFRVQLASVKAKARAVKEAGRLNRLHKLVLGNLKVVPVRANLGKRGIFYRLRTGPLNDRAAANALCRKLSARKQGCMVAKR